jgi:hypothetical protein
MIQPTYCHKAISPTFQMSRVDLMDVQYTYPMDW